MAITNVTMRMDEDLKAQLQEFLGNIGMYTIKATNRFKKDLKTIIKRVA